MTQQQTTLSDNTTITNGRAGQDLAASIDVVIENWKLITPIADTAVHIFFGKLFELHPEVRKLFADDTKDQEIKLGKMLNFIVRNLKNLEMLEQQVQSLAIRHLEFYNVTVDQIPYVKPAFIWALQQGLEEKCTPEVEAAWNQVLDLLIKIMTEAMIEHAKNTNRE